MNKQETRSEEKDRGIEQDDNMPTHLTSMHTEQERKRKKQEISTRVAEKIGKKLGRTAQIYMP